jgi:tRNA 2-thiouridine synthesizing protein A
MPFLPRRAAKDQPKRSHIPVDKCRSRALAGPMTPDHDIDALGLLCPLPVLRLRKVLLAARPGAVIRILADDPVARIDIPHFCAEQGAELLQTEDMDQGTAFTIRAS